MELEVYVEDNNIVTQANEVNLHCLDYCRTCMKFNNANKSDFTNLFNFPQLLQMLTSCSSIQVHIDDGLPEQVCSTCVETLTVAYEFKKRCEQVDVQLRQIFLCKITKSEENLNIKIKQEPIEVKSELTFENNNDNDDFRDSDNEPLGNIEVKDSKVKSKRKKIIKTPAAHKCDVCEKTFPKNSKLLRHLKVHEKEINTKEHPCEICQRVFDRASKLERHIKIHNPELKPYPCKHCEKRFKSESLLLTHLVSHQNIVNGENISIDGTTLKQEDGSEIKNEVKVEKYPCEQCEKFFYTSHSLSAHMRKHRVKNRILACSICGKVFKKSSHLKRHERTHEDNRPFKCSQCTKSFALERQLIEHANKHKGIKPHQCPVCSKAFAQTSTLNAHLRVHTREKPFLCATCGKRFDSSTNLNQHLKRHLGEKTFYCTLCPGRYVSKGELQSHMSTHTGARPFVCDTCGSAFTKTNSLAKHKLIHLGIKPHECDVCAMRFNSKDHLKRHYRIHTGEKPYKCEFCERAFTQSNDLVKHTRSHLGDKMYKCTYCPESFRLKTELRKHVSIHFVNKSQSLGTQQAQDTSGESINFINNKSLLTMSNESQGESSNSFTDNDVAMHFTNNKSNNSVIERQIKVENVDYSQSASVVIETVPKMSS